jgi:hypothetical protein
MSSKKVMGGRQSAILTFMKDVVVLMTRSRPNNDSRTAKRWFKSQFRVVALFFADANAEGRPSRSRSPQCRQRPSVFPSSLCPREGRALEKEKGTKRNQSQTTGEGQLSVIQSLFRLSLNILNSL